MVRILMVVLVVALLLAIAGSAYTATDSQPTFKFSGYAQLRYSGAEREVPDAFAVRSIRPTFSGELGTPLPASYMLQLEAAGSSGSHPKVTDAFMDLRPEGWKLRAGQFKIPFGYDNPLSTPKRLEPEPALVIDTLFPGLRDQGLSASFPLGPTSGAQLIVGIVNGQGINSADSNDHKDLFLRLESSKYKLHGGISAYSGKYFDSTIPGDVDKNRYGLDVQWTGNQVQILGEYVAGEGWHGPPGVQGYASAGFYDQEFSGGYLSVYYQRPGSPHIGYLRYDVFDPDRNAGGDIVKTTTIGYAREIKGLNRVSIAYESRDDAAGGTQNWIVAQLQTTWSWSPQ